MSLTKQQALDFFRSDDLIGLGMEADALRRKLHPEGVATTSSIATLITPTSARNTAPSAHFMRR